MQNFNMQNFIELAFLTGIVINAVAGVFIVAFVIPLQLKQVEVKNGLIKLRKQMLTKGVLSIIVIIATIAVLATVLIAPDIDILAYFIAGLVLIQAIGILGKSFIDYKIYHQQYSQVSKDMHERIEVLEKGDRLRENNKHNKS